MDRRDLIEAVWARGILDLNEELEMSVSRRRESQMQIEQGILLRLKARWKDPHSLSPFISSGIPAKNQN